MYKTASFEFAARTAANFADAETVEAVVDLVTTTKN
jgi:hypothetical protein